MTGFAINFHVNDNVSGVSRRQLGHCGSELMLNMSSVTFRSVAKVGCINPTDSEIKVCIVADMENHENC
jgi:hypothetical protein